MNKIIFTAFILAFCPALHAQERVAGGALDSQMTWTALSNKIDQASQKTDILQAQVDQIKKCGAKRMSYTPGAAGADSDGCSANFVVTGGGQCLTPEAGAGNGTAWTIRSAWGQATGCAGGVPQCNGSTVLHIGYGTDKMGDGEVSNFCRYRDTDGIFYNACHTQSFLCVRGI